MQVQHVWGVVVIVIVKVVESSMQLRRMRRGGRAVGRLVLNEIMKVMMLDGGLRFWMFGCRSSCGMKL